MTKLLSWLTLLKLAFPLQPLHGQVQYCYTSWEDLAQDISETGSNNSTTTTASGGEFRICPGTVFNLDLFLPPITIESDNIQITCGHIGSRQDECRVIGGETQFIILDSASGVKFSGLTFDSAYKIAVVAGGNADAEATFEDCVWQGNGGSASLSLAESLGGKGMTVNLIGCTFNRNANINAILQNNGGILNLHNTMFTNNSAKAGTITVSNSGNISMANNCFVGNGSSNGVGSNGTVALYGDSSLLENKNNFGDDNIVEGWCSDIILFKDDVCEEFASSGCMQNYTTIPTNAVTAQPTIGDNTTATNAPTQSLAAKTSTPSTIMTKSPISHPPTQPNFTTLPILAPTNHPTDNHIVSTAPPTLKELSPPSNKPADSVSPIPTTIPIVPIQKPPSTHPTISPKAGKTVKDYKAKSVKLQPFDKSKSGKSAGKSKKSQSKSKKLNESGLFPLKAFRPKGKRF